MTVREMLDNLESEEEYQDFEVNIELPIDPPIHKEDKVTVKEIEWDYADKVVYLRLEYLA